MNIVKKLKGLRTVVVNVVGGAVPIIQASGIVQILPDGWMPYYLVGMCLANVLLRMATDTPVGRGEHPAETELRTLKSGKG